MALAARGIIPSLPLDSPVPPCVLCVLCGQLRDSGLVRKKRESPEDGVTQGIVRTGWNPSLSGEVSERSRSLSAGMSSASAAWRAGSGRGRLLFHGRLNLFGCRISSHSSRFHRRPCRGAAPTRRNRACPSREPTPLRRNQTSARRMKCTWVGTAKRTVETDPPPAESPLPRAKTPGRPAEMDLGRNHSARRTKWNSRQAAKSQSQNRKSTVVRNKTSKACSTKPFAPSRLCASHPR